MNKDKQISVLYFGSYSLNNSRNAILMRGLKENGVRILECNDHSKFYILKYIKLLFKYLKYIGKFDVMVVGFAGQEMMPLARVLTRKPIFFDVFTSHYMGYILDRKYFSPQSLRAKYYHFIDKFSCWLADIVILDTQAHIEYFIKEFNIPRGKLIKVPLGANSELFRPHPHLKGQDKGFRVVFWGTFIPLQGIKYIIEAAKLLDGDGVDIFIIGNGGQTYEHDKKYADELKLNNLHFLGRLLPGKMEAGELNRQIAMADVCLGCFGESIKTDVTIQNKIFETLASSKALLTARTTALQELLVDGKHCLMCRAADTKDLADKITILKNDTILRNSISEEGYKFFVGNLLERKLGSIVLGAIQQMIKT